MSPLEIEILMHYWTSPGDYRDGDFSAAVVADAMRHFTDHGIIFENEAGKAPRYKGDMKALQVYFKALSAIPLPVLTWVIPAAEQV